MKNFFIGLLVLLTAALNLQCKKQLTFTCDVDTTKTGYELAGAYDDCLVWNAQKTMTRIEEQDIDIGPQNYPCWNSVAPMRFERCRNWIQPFYTFITETGAYLDPVGKHQ